MKTFFQEYFSFSKKERTGILTLLVLILIFICLPFLYPLFIHHKKTDPAAFEKELAALRIKETDSSDHYEKYSSGEYNSNSQPWASAPQENNYNKYSKGELFYFDPNTVSEADWQRLGLRDKTIATILNYRNKGGHFYKPEDIGKIWGLHEDEVQRLLPYVQIAKQESPTFPTYSKEENHSYEKIKAAPSIININDADTTAFIALPGIGSKLAQRIVTFRDKLGGFYKVEQVAETYGLPDSTFQKIKSRLVANNTAVKKININTATMDELKVHPYLRYNLANAIVQYRAQHGAFSTVEDLRKIMLFTEDILAKAAPYLSVQ